MRSKSGREVLLHVQSVVNRLESFGYPTQRYHSDRAKELRSATFTVGESPAGNRAEVAVQALKGSTRKLLNVALLRRHVWAVTLLHASARNWALELEGSPKILLTNTIYPVRNSVPGEPRKPRYRLTGKRSPDFQVRVAAAAVIERILPGMKGPCLVPSSGGGPADPELRRTARAKSWIVGAAHESGSSFSFSKLKLKPIQPVKNRLTLPRHNGRVQTGTPGALSLTSPNRNRHQRALLRTYPQHVPERPDPLPRPYTLNTTLCTRLILTWFL